MPSPEVLIPGLPNELGFDILARVPRQYHPVLLAVSKSFRSAISSPQLFTTRSLLNSTENLLYFKVSFSCVDSDDWFAIHQKSVVSSTDNPNRTSFLRFVRIQPNPSKLTASGYAAVGPNIYAIGVFARNLGGAKHSSDVWILDYRSHTWQKGPSMLTPRLDVDVATVGNKIYVFGGGMMNKPLVEVFDPLVGQWEHVPSPHEDGCSECSEFVEVLDVVYDIFIFIMDMVTFHGFRLDVETNRWEESEDLVDDQRIGDGVDCVVDGVTYRCSEQWPRLQWFDERNMMWTMVKGVVEGKNIVSAKCVNLKERLVVMWAEVNEWDVELWCAEIDVFKNKDDDGELWGREVHKFSLLPQVASSLTVNDLRSANWAFRFYRKSLSVSL
ncbi:F-box/kelch-repeat protein At4g39560-like [Humulus lupulus]|uniref:F-box/kelch-repeat protein At4g39560-like n=1 Tax=Humulus lupulus TaxID=3486 RepID=UPI002B417902|nr:F-box/kelch-repeat protein At4g39560-like [Humulus lupulus]